MRILNMVLVLLGYLSKCSGQNCRPKKTFTKVVPPNLENEGYMQMYIQIQWCMFPCEPSEPSGTKHLYASVGHHTKKRNHINGTKSFKIEQHIKCRNSSSEIDEDKKIRNSSSKINETEVQDYMREEYIREGKIPHGILAEAGIRCKSGPYIFQHWLGNKTLIVVSPWAQVMRCIDDRECEATKKSLRYFPRTQHVGVAHVNISAYNHIECRKRS